MAGRDRGHLRYLALVGLVALLWWQTDMTLPPDLGGWRPAALPGELVYDLAEIEGDRYAAAHTGLYDLSGEEPAEPFGDLPTPVVRIAQDGKAVLAGTYHGIYRLGVEGDVSLDGLAEQRVNDLAHSASRWLAATDDGAYERVEGDWVRRWPLDEDARVLTIAGWEGGLLVGTRDGITRVDLDREVAEQAWEGEVVRSLIPDDRDEQAGRIWAGIVEGDVLLASDDDGRSWEAAGDGIRLLSAQDVRSDPADPDRLVVGGTGVDDGELLGGVMTSEDGGRTWESEPNRLSNTHVYRLAVDREPLTVTVGWPFTARATSVVLPVDITRFRAATNGAGVYTFADPPTALSMLATLQPAVRVVEPLVVGGIFLALVWQLARISGPVAGSRSRDTGSRS